MSAAPSAIAWVKKRCTGSSRRRTREGWKWARSTPGGDSVPEHHDARGRHASRPGYRAPSSGRRRPARPRPRARRKAAVRTGERWSRDNDHAVLARRFAERFTGDERVLAALELARAPSLTSPRPRVLLTSTDTSAASADAVALASAVASSQSPTSPSPTSRATRRLISLGRTRGRGWSALHRAHRAAHVPSTRERRDQTHPRRRRGLSVRCVGALEPRISSAPHERHARPPPTR